MKSWVSVWIERLPCDAKLARRVVRRVLSHCNNKRRPFEGLMRHIAQAARECPQACAQTSRTAFMRMLRSRIEQLRLLELIAKGVVVTISKAQQAKEARQAEPVKAGGGFTQGHS